VKIVTPREITSQVFQYARIVKAIISVPPAIRRINCDDGRTQRLKTTQRDQQCADELGLRSFSSLLPPI